MITCRPKSTPSAIHDPKKGINKKPLAENDLLLVLEIDYSHFFPQQSSDLSPEKGKNGNPPKMIIKRHVIASAPPLLRMHGFFVRFAKPKRNRKLVCGLSVHHPSKEAASSDRACTLQHDPFILDLRDRGCRGNERTRQPFCSQRLLGLSIKLKKRKSDASHFSAVEV